MSHPADDIAHWLEVMEASVIAETYEAIVDSPLEPGVLRDGDAVTFWLSALDEGFFNRSIGLGVGRPATEAALDASIDAWRAHGLSSFAVTVSPLARPAALERWLEARGFRRGRRLAKLWRDVQEPPEERSALRIERLDAEDRDVFVRVGLEGFGMPPSLGAIFGAMVGRAGWAHYLAFDGDTPVGTGAMRLRGDVAWLGFGSTVPSHRGRGGQSAMFARRIRDARDGGATLCVTETGEELPNEPNPSYRNMLRAGFRLGYHRQNWLPPVPDEARPDEAPSDTSGASPEG